MSEYAKVAYMSDSSDMSRVNDVLSSGPDPQYMIDYDVLYVLWPASYTY